MAKKKANTVSTKKKSETNKKKSGKGTVPGSSSTLKPITPPKSTETKKIFNPVKKIKRGLANKKKNLIAKYNRFKKKLSQKWANFKVEFVGKRVYVKGEEQPSSYSFDKKFYGLYILFFIYSLITIWIINDPTMAFLTFGRPFEFGNTLIAFYLTLSVLLSIDPIRDFIFGKKTYIKQVIIFGGIIAVYFVMFLIISTNLNFLTYFLALSMIWLLLLSVRFYVYARRFSTKIEAGFISKYSVSRYLVALIVPFVILGVLVITSWFYRTLLVFIAIGFFGPNDPANAVNVYQLEMRLVMPLIYFSLVLTLMFIIFEFVFTRRRAETKRAGCFDNFTFSLIVLFIFFFQLFQMTIFLLLRPETVEALRNSVGATSTTVSAVFLVEFGISMVFLYRIITRLGGSLGWRVLFFKKDGMILFFLACVMAQSLVRLSLASDIQNQDLTAIGEWLMADKYIISVLMITFLGITLLIYYLKPRETSMFMRMQKEMVSDEDRSMEIIYKIIRTEYIRRGEAFPLKILERELIKTTKLSKGLVYALLTRLANKDMDILLEEKEDKHGNKTKMIDFLSITEQFQKKDVADKKAKQYMSKRFIETISSEKRKTLKLAEDKKSKKEQAADSFISSLSTEYQKKQKALEEREKSIKAKKGKISFKSEKVSEIIKKRILKIIKDEYVFRVEDPDEFDEISIPISEIYDKVYTQTKISDVYSIVKQIAKEDIEIEVRKNPKDQKDDIICLFPLTDERLIFALTNFRPQLYSDFRIRITKLFVTNLGRKKTNSVIANLKREIPSQTEKQDKWKEILSILFNRFPKYEKYKKYVKDRQKLKRIIDDYKIALENARNKKKKK